MGLVTRSAVGLWVQSLWQYSVKGLEVCVLVRAGAAQRFSKVGVSGYDPVTFHHIYSDYHYYVIPLVDLNEDEIQQLEYMPTIFSSASDEFIDENGKATYTMRLFEEDLPELTSEEEVEILYKILTKKDLFIK